ncbi:MAG: hypothetical protein CMB80_00405 [Flammeovirgaceae bacterium]|nr:hypothetical protein [Flammeovirgaceae bacterium]|tara:strand:- start:6631 stop:7233 length:603 start_codon:yes stop_codon:yes gene_type:complete
MIVILDYQKFDIPNTDASVMIKPLQIRDYQRLIRFTGKSMVEDSSSNSKFIQDLEEISEVIQEKESQKKISPSTSEILLEKINTITKSARSSINESSNLERMGDEEVSKLSLDIIPRYCKDLVGIEFQIDGAKRNATVDDLVKYGAFLTICFTILTHLLTMSSMTQPEEIELKKTLPGVMQEEELPTPIELLPESQKDSG